ncbi:MAG: sulfatase [Planctomycetota bacterium]
MATWKTRIGAGAALGGALGALVAAAEIAVVVGRGGDAPAGPGEAIGLLAPLVAGGLLGTLIGLDAGRLGRPAFGVAVALLGFEAAQGARAATWPLAASWGPLAGSLAFLLSFLPRRRRTDLLLAAVGLGLLAASLLTLPGLYPRLRLAAAIVGALLVAPRLHLRRPFRAAAAFAPPLVLVATVALVGPALGRWGRPDWVLDRAPLSGPLLAELRFRLLPPIAEDTEAWNPPAPWSESEAGRAALDDLRSRGGLPRGVLVLSLDAWRRDRLGAEIGGRAVTPFLDALRARSVEFTRAYSPAPSTEFSLRAALGGWSIAPLRQFTGELAGAPLVTSALNRAGVVTRSAIARAPFGPGLPPGRPPLDFAAGTSRDWSDPSPEEIAAAIRPDAPGDRWFAWVHLLRPHAPYEDAGEAFRSGDSPAERHAAELRHADDDARRLLGILEAEGRLRETWIIVTSDHGEAFGEHGLDFHATSVHEETVAVPLFVSGPGLTPGRRADCVSLIDLAPTLADVFGLPRPPRGFGGRSLLPRILGLEDPARVETVVVENPPLGSHRFSAQAALIGPRYKLIEDLRARRRRLFDLETDPGERRDIADDRPEITASMARELGRRRLLPGATTPPPVAAGIAELLREAERLGPGAMASTLLLAADLDVADRLRGLLYFCDRRDEVALRELLARERSRDGGRDAALEALLEGALEGRLPAAGPDDRRPAVLAARFDLGLRDASDATTARLAALAPEEWPDDLDARLAGWRWRGIRLEDRAPTGLLVAGLRAPSAWTRSRALRILGEEPQGRREPDECDTLDRALVEVDPTTLSPFGVVDLAAAMRTRAVAGGRQAVRRALLPRLRRLAREGALPATPERGRTLSLLLSAVAQCGDVPARRYLVSEHPGRGFAAPGAGTPFAEMLADRAELPLEAVPGPRLVGLFLEMPPLGRLVIEGGGRRFEIGVGAESAGLPLVIEGLSPAAGALRLERREGAKPSCGGYVDVDLDG